MENHPIPQDVTGFQFRLIGDMTVKQFAFLGGGGLLGWFFFAIMPIPALIKLPLAIGIAGAGAALAFVPIEGRPMDVMVINFAKALFTPTLYMYKKNGGLLSFTAVHTVAPKVASAKTTATPDTKNQVHDSSLKLQQYLNSLPQAPKNALDEKEMVFFQSISQGFGASPTASQTPIQAYAQQQPQAPKGPEYKPAPQPKPQEEPAPTQAAADTEEKLQKEEVLVKQALDMAKQEEQKEQQQHPGAMVSHEKVEELEKEMQDIMMQKQQLEGQLLRLQQQMQAKPTGPVFTPTQTTAPVATKAPKVTQNVRTIPKGMENQAGILKAPDAPNVIMGIIKDPRGNLLANILVEVKDKDGSPVRAFKTNQLGQFASATPLLNGTYTVSFEDSSGKSKFDTIEITADGQVLQPLEIISTDEREQLRKSLFG